MSICCVVDLFVSRITPKILIRFQMLGLGGGMRCFAIQVLNVAVIMFVALFERQDCSGTSSRAFVLHHKLTSSLRCCTYWSVHLSHACVYCLFSLFVLVHV